jgi:hypothetical protein
MRLAMLRLLLCRFSIDRTPLSPGESASEQLTCLRVSRKLGSQMQDEGKRGEEVVLIFYVVQYKLT